VPEGPVFNPRGSVAEVPGFRVGHAEHPELPTGCTVVLCPPDTVGGLEVRGSAPATRQCDGLHPGAPPSQVHAALFTGGSSFGLDAAGGVQSFLEEQGVGLAAGPVRLPKVPTAVIFDLPITGGRGRPGPELARAACAAADTGPMPRGNRGAGAGATVGKLYGLERACKGGVGGASLELGRLKMGALAVVNAFGDVLDEKGRILAGARTGPDEHRFVDTAAWFLRGNQRPPFQVPMNTTLGLVTTNARLDKADACRVAALAHHGLVRTVDPVHTIFDGDLVLVLGSGPVEADITGLGLMAGRLMQMAIRDAVRSARGLPGLPAACDLDPGAAAAL